MDALDPGVAGVRDPGRPLGGSDGWRRRFRPSKSPKLFLPIVDEFRGSAWRSSTDGRGETPRELMVEDRPLLVMLLRVGDVCPELRECGRKKAVAGDEFDLDLVNRARAEGCACGVMCPLPVDGREGVGVCWEPV